jgi:hypothetical protein
MPRKTYGQACEHNSVIEIKTYGGDAFAYQCVSCSAMWPAERYEQFRQFVERVDRYTQKRWGPKCAG